MLMNNRFVVPGVGDNVTTFYSLDKALNTPGLNPGDVIQIEPNSSPGSLNHAEILAASNLTVQGDPAFDVQSIPYFQLGDVSVAVSGFTFKNVEIDIVSGGFGIAGGATITGCRIKDDWAGNAIYSAWASSAAITNCYIESSTAQTPGAGLIGITPADGSHNVISDNQFVALAGQNISLLDYGTGGAGSTDVVANNSFIDNTGASYLVKVDGTTGLTLLDNTFTSTDSSGTAIDVASAQVQIVGNTISLPNSTAFTATGITVADTTGTNVVIATNHISTGSNGIGIGFQPLSTSSILSAKVQGNDLQGNRIGVEVDQGAGGWVAGIDLGGGVQGSLGGNDFRRDAGLAIYVTAPSGEGPIVAMGNIFGIADPTTVIDDHHNNPSFAAVVSTGALTGNAAYVETLYQDYLHRCGDVTNQKDAGHWVTLLDQGTPAATVASDIVRSGEALGVAVDGLYHRFLGRDADSAGRANFVSFLESGGTLEGVSQAMLASSEYQTRFPTAASFVQSLYGKLLNRIGSSAEVNSWVVQLPQLGRAGIAQGFLLAQEYRSREISDDYTWFLNRTGSASDIASWASGGKDLLTIDALFAASPEFQMNG
jgi:hypothetical protein